MKRPSMKCPEIVGTEGRGVGMSWYLEGIPCSMPYYSSSTITKHQISEIDFLQMLPDRLCVLGINSDGLVELLELIR